MSVYSTYSIPAGAVRMIAHQGYSAVAPGNTLPAYEAAGKSDFWGAECDIQRTKDGVWILMHNDTVDAMTDGTGEISELTYAEIMEFNVDSGNNIEISGVDGWSKKVHAVTVSDDNTKGSNIAEGTAVTIWYK